MRGYTNRELSWLAFNHRVLMESRNENDPLFERVRFAGIVFSNMEEFLRVRMGKLRARTGRDASGWDAGELFDEAMLQSWEQLQAQQRILKDELFPAMTRCGLCLAAPQEWTDAQRGEAQRIYEEELKPLLAEAVPVELPEDALAIPYGSLYLYLSTSQEDMDGWRIIRVPDRLKRLYVLEKSADTVCAALLEDILLTFAAGMWPDTTRISAFEIVRDATYEVDDRSRARLLKSLRKALARQKKGQILCLRYRSFDGSQPDGALFSLSWRQMFPMPAALSVKAVTEALDLVERPELNWKPFASRNQLSQEKKLFRAIRQQDRFLFHPYDSFDAILRFLQQAAEDPKVISIKQTLYRVSKKSPVCDALIRAASNGKQVTVLMEAKARFDERNNIRWGKALEDAGCLVIYGVPGLKIHSKIILVTRREDGKNTCYCHLGTGNYNEKTARIYTDMGILTANREIGQDAAGYFSLVEGYREIKGMKRLVSAPGELRKTLLWLIRKETENARRGREAAIEAKMNSLVDEKIIAALYEASRAGVRVDLIVRGICCLQPGVPGLSDNITVRSIVGRFLEHARVFRFCQEGKWATWLSSADWMPRNLDRRMELMFPVQSPEICRQIEEILRLQRADTSQAWLLHGTEWLPARSTTGDRRINAQEAFIPEP